LRDGKKIGGPRECFSGSSEGEDFSRKTWCLQFLAAQDPSDSKEIEDRDRRNPSTLLRGMAKLDCAESSLLEIISKGTAQRFRDTAVALIFLRKWRDLI